MAGAGQPHLSASLMCARLDALGEEIEALEEAGIDAFHLDVMDGHFVPNLALSTDTVAAIRARTRLPLEVHLMVTEPGSYLAALGKAGADVVFFHLESTPSVDVTARAAREAGIAPGIALRPGTQPPASSQMDGIAELLLMAVEPGFAGGAWLSDTPQRVRAASREAGARVRIHVDGHVNAETAALSHAAGATGFVCGSSSLFRSRRREGRQLQAIDYAERLRALRAALAVKSAPGIVPGFV